MDRSAYSGRSPVLDSNDGNVERTTKGHPVGSGLGGKAVDELITRLADRVCEASGEVRLDRPDRYVPVAGSLDAVGGQAPTENVTGTRQAVTHGC